MRLTLLLALLPTLALAQSPAPRSEDLGTVTGHVICADTGRPARNAAVSLISRRLPGTDDVALMSYNPDAIGPIHTDRTGAYTITSVPPGQYYLRVDLTGYITPIQQFTPSELKAPTPEIEQRIQRELQLITVAPNSTLQADVTLRRSGSISGKILYDDGSPVININIQFARRDANGKLQAFARAGYLTDSHGDYGIESLSAAEYAIRIQLAAEEQEMRSAQYGDGITRTRLQETPFVVLPIYSGSVFRERDAAIIKVEDGQETGDVNITIPISRLHEVDGTLLASDGGAINDGRIALLYPDTHDELESVRAHEDGTFRLPLVPEGDYIIAVTEARDKTEIQIPFPTNPSGFSVRTRTLRTYGTLAEPLTVDTDIQSLNLTLPDKPTPTTPSE
jgi:protocatechuate 3,4-dioxygenase beta subunit